MNDLVKKAAEKATLWHGDQKRKYTNEPYIHHPTEVAVTLHWAGCSRNEVAAGFLHDVKEDCGISHEILLDEFNEEIARIVDEVTDRSRPSDGNRAVRKEIDRKWIARASPGGKSVKLCDILSNTRSIVEHDKKFALVYLREKNLLLPCLAGGNENLFLLVEDQLTRYSIELGLIGRRTYA